MKTSFHGISRMLSALMPVVAAALMGACATNPVSIGAVGPRPDRSFSTKGQGSLIVYTSTETRRLDKTIPYYIHTSYTVSAKDGRQVKWVENHTGDMDQAPQMVSLPAGEYVIRAHSDDYGTVDIPVVIGAMRTTEVYLDGTWTRHKHDNSGPNLVRMPNGRVVGWSALVSR